MTDAPIAPTLHRRIERADARLVPMDEFAVDIDEQVAVAFVELLEHGGVSSKRAA